MPKPRALRPADRVAVVSPASPFSRDEFDKGIDEIRAMIDHFGLDVVQAYMRHVQDNAEEAVRRVIDCLDDGHYRYVMSPDTRGELNFHMFQSPELTSTTGEITPGTRAINIDGNASQWLPAGFRGPVSSAQS